MQYKGIYLLEMTPEKWDSLPLDSTRDMFVWKYEDEPILQKRKVIEWFKNKNGAVIWRDENNELWNFCAEIPIVAEEDAMKLLKDNEKEILELKAENKELKEKIKSLNFNRIVMANAVSRDIDDVLIEMSVYKHFNQDTPGLAIAIITELVRRKILEYKSEFRRMTYKELSEWLAKGKGQYKNGNFGSFRTELVYCKNEENTIVDNDCLIRGFNETEWHEPLIEE